MTIKNGILNLILLLGGLNLPAFAQTIYQSVDKEGVTTFSDQPLPETTPVKTLDISVANTITQPKVNAPSAAVTPPPSAIIATPARVIDNSSFSAPRADATSTTTQAVSDAYITLLAAKQTLQKRTAAYQELKEKIARLPASMSDQRLRQQKILMQAKIAIDSARDHVQAAEATFANVTSRHPHSVALSD